MVNIKGMDLDTKKIHEAYSSNKGAINEFLRVLNYLKPPLYKDGWKDPTEETRKSFKAYLDRSERSDGDYERLVLFLATPNFCESNKEENPFYFLYYDMWSFMLFTIEYAQKRITICRRIREPNKLTEAVKQIQSVTTNRDDPALRQLYINDTLKIKDLNTIANI